MAINELRIGDQVLCNGCFGMEPARLVRVTGIVDGGKHGRPVDVIEWSAVHDVDCAVKCGRRVVVDLDNGHWAYGNQIEPAHEQQARRRSEPQTIGEIIGAGGSCGCEEKAKP